MSGMPRWRNTCRSSACCWRLFTAGGGILVEGGRIGTPAGNTALLALGTALAGVMGTTGVAMVLIHPLLRGNAHRVRKVHLVVFFIVLVANAGGATTPLGDPPLYLGFLHGVPFGWPLMNLTAPLLAVALPLLGGFWLLDRHLARGEPAPPPPRPLRLRGRRNAVLVLLVVAERAAARRLAPRRGGAARPVDRPGAAGRHRGVRRHHRGLAADHPARPARAQPVQLGAYARGGGAVRRHLHHHRAGAGHVGRRAGRAAGAAAGAEPDRRRAALATGDLWLAGLLSGFLDNAPTYLVFFNLAGGDPAALTGPLAPVRGAVGGGGVFRGTDICGQRAQHDGARHRRAARRSHAGVLRLHIVAASALLLPLFAVLSILGATNI